MSLTKRHCKLSKWEINMFKITIKSQKHGELWVEKQTLAEVEEYKQQCAESAHWGKPASVEVIPAQEEIKDESGKVVQEAMPEQVIEHPAEYELVVEDISVQVMQEKVNAECLQYLAETDWMAIRESETGVKMSEEVKLKRQECRDKIVKQ